MKGSTGSIGVVCDAGQSGAGCFGAVRGGDSEGTSGAGKLLEQFLVDFRFMVLVLGEGESKDEEKGKRIRERGRDPRERSRDPSHRNEQVGEFGMLGSRVYTAKDSVCENSLTGNNQTLRYRI